MFNLKSIANKIDGAIKGVATEAIITQAISQSVKEQPSISFPSNSILEEYEKKLNACLVKEKAQAGSYLNKYMKNILGIIERTYNYYRIQTAVTKALKKSATVEQWVDCINMIKMHAKEHILKLSKFETELESLYTRLYNLESNFCQLTQDINTAVNGDKGIVALLKNQVGRIDQKITGLASGMIIGGISMVLGTVLIVIGSVAAYYTDTGVNKLIIGSDVAIEIGLSLTAGTGIELKKIMDEKISLFRNKDIINNEVALTLGICNGAKSVSGKVRRLMRAVIRMQDGWEVLYKSLEYMERNLQNKEKTTGQIFLKFEMASVASENVLTNIDVIKNKMSGVSILVDENDQNLGDKIVDVIQHSS